MLKCGNCGAPLNVEKGLKFCPYCGATVEIDHEAELEMEKLKLDHEHRENRAKEHSERKDLVLGAVLSVVALIFLLIIIMMMRS